MQSCGWGAYNRQQTEERRKTLALAALSFLDEFGLTLALARPHTRARVGARVTVTPPFTPGRTILVISALRSAGSRGTESRVSQQIDKKRRPAG